MGKRVLITGAGGYIGSALARYLHSISLQALVLLDIAEGGLFELYSEMQGRGDLEGCSVIVGDVCDTALLHEIFEQHRPQIIFHAAACKHVTLMEVNPFAAAYNNILGTHRIIEAANKGLADQVIVVSTDKAVEPIGMMGVSKRVAELLVAASDGPAQVKAMRLANVLGSAGSVGPIFAQQVIQGGPLRITDPHCTRYFLSIDEVVHRLISALALDGSSMILAAEAGEPFSIVDLANYLIEHVPHARKRIEIEYTGLRAGEKLTECMVSRSEDTIPSKLSFLQIVGIAEPIIAETLREAIREIDQATQIRSLTDLLATIQRLVPDYRSSLQVRETVDESGTETAK